MENFPTERLQNLFQIYNLFFHMIGEYINWNFNTFIIYATPAFFFLSGLHINYMMGQIHQYSNCFTLLSEVSDYLHVIAHSCFHKAYNTAFKQEI